MSSPGLATPSPTLSFPSASPSAGAGPSFPRPGGSTGLTTTPNQSQRRRKRPNASKLRRSESADLSRALDEGDDVSDSEIEAPRQRRFLRVDEDYEGEGEGEGDGDGDGEDAREEEGDGEGDEEEDATVNLSRGRAEQGEAGDAPGTGEGITHPEGVKLGARHLGGQAGDTATQADADRRKREREEEARKKEWEVEVGRKAKKRRGEQLMLRNHLDPEQARRFDAFQTAFISKQSIVRLNRDLLDQRVGGGFASILAGMAKIFVADVVELAKEIQPHTKHPVGPLQPYHLQLARLKMQEMGMLGGGGASGTGGNGRTGTALRAKKSLLRR